jgi:hypothetical protein
VLSARGCEHGVRLQHIQVLVLVHLY